MSESLLDTEETTKLKERLTAVIDGFRDTLSSLVDHPVECDHGEIRLIDGAGLCDANTGSGVVLTTMLGGSSALRTVLPRSDAHTLNALMAGLEPDAVSEKRAKEGWDDEDDASFDVVAKAVGSAIEGAVAEFPAPMNAVSETNHDPIEPGGGISGPQSLVCCPIHMRIGDHPEATVHVAVDLPVAEAWNEAPIPMTSTGPSEESSDEESLDDIPEAPIRGKLTAYLANSSPWRTLRRSCRRVGLELRRRARAEVPNPAAHRGEFVLMDVPVGEERRFGWCKRLKEFHDDVTVVLLVHAPSRNRVLQGFMAKADVILGWPLGEAELSPRLAQVLEPDEAPEDEEPKKP